MKKIRLLSLLVGLALLATGPLLALVPVPALPASLPQSQRATWEARHTALQKQHADYQADEDDFYRQYGKEIDEKDPRAPAATARLAELAAEVKRINAETRRFRRELQTELRTVETDLTRQIDEIGEQMRGLGFSQSAEEFERLNLEAADALRRLKQQMWERMKDLVLAKAEKLTSEAILHKVQQLEPATIQGLLGQLQRAGVRNVRLEQLVRGLAPTNSRAALVEHAQELLDVIGKEQALWEAAEALDQETVEERQAAALALVSVVLDHPFLDELKLVAHASFNVGEAWFYYAVLSQTTNELMATTEQRLAAQKVVIKRLETLVARRKVMRTEIAEL